MSQIKSDPVPSPAVPADIDLSAIIADGAKATPDQSAAMAAELAPIRRVQQRDALTAEADARYNLWRQNIALAFGDVQDMPTDLDGVEAFVPTPPPAPPVVEPPPPEDPAVTALRDAAAQEQSLFDSNLARILELKLPVPATVAEVLAWVEPENP